VFCTPHAASAQLPGASPQDNIAIHERRRDMLELRQEAVKTMALPACVCGINEFHTIL